MLVQGTQSNPTYRILISRSQQCPIADLYSIDLRQPLPSFPIPLKPADAEPTVPLQDVFSELYDRARYGKRIDYCQPVPLPELSESDQQWVNSRLASLRAL